MINAWQQMIIGPKIGKGSYAVVYEGKYAGTHVAIKEIFFQSTKEETMKEFSKVWFFSNWIIYDDL